MALGSSKTGVLDLERTLALSAALFFGGGIIA